MFLDFEMAENLFCFKSMPLMLMIFHFAIVFDGHADISKVMCVVLQLKNHHTNCGGLANANLQRMGAESVALS